MLHNLGDSTDFPADMHAGLDVSQSPVPATRPVLHGSPGGVLTDSEEDLFSEFSSGLTESFTSLFSDDGTPISPADYRKQTKSRTSDKVELEVQKRTAQLEEQLGSAVNQKLQAEVRHKKDMERLEDEVTRSHKEAASQLAELQTRQAAIEAEAPVLKNAVAQAKAQLQDLQISNSLYEEVAQITPEKRTLREEMLFQVHAITLRHKQDEEQLRLDRDTARDAAARAVEDVDRLRMENSHLVASVSMSQRDSEKQQQVANARNDRQQHDLEEALLKVEVLTAKGKMFDEVTHKLEELQKAEAHWEDARAADKAELNLLRKERESINAQMVEKVHAVDLLQMDKAYLSKEVQSLGERCAELETQYDKCHNKLREVKKARNDLQEKVLSSTEDQRLAHEQRLQAEISRLQEQHLSDIDKVRAEAVHVAEQEVRLLRDRRDTAETEARRTTSKLKEVQGAYDDLLEAHREQQRLGDQRQAEAYSELKMKAFEADRVSILQEEAAQSLRQTKLEADMLQKKLKVATDNCYHLETNTSRKIAELEAIIASQAARLNHYEMLEADIDSAVLQSGAVSQDAAQTGMEIVNIGTGVPTAVQRRVQQSLGLARK
ncbi:hypothetical protein CYMTET_43176 [Cymbomonas tetramitiformis]|nr:hypothetical protein CYMTET_43176 [Cymbomonas tetramitiformis]